MKDSSGLYLPSCGNSMTRNIDFSPFPRKVQWNDFVKKPYQK